MIDKALTTIISKLKSKMGLEGGKLNYLQADTNQLGKILCSVSNIMFEAAPSRSLEGSGLLLLQFRLNFQSNFEASAYPEGLKHLSTILNYLFHNPVFDAQNSPELPSEITKITLAQIETQSNEGSLPAVAFEVSIAIVNSVQGEIPQVEAI